MENPEAVNMSISFEGGIKFMVEAKDLSRLKPETMKKLSEVLTAIVIELNPPVVKEPEPYTPPEPHPCPKSPSELEMERLLAAGEEAHDIWNDDQAGD